MTWRNCSGKRRNLTQTMSSESHPSPVTGLSSKRCHPARSEGPTLLKLVILSEAKDLCTVCAAPQKPAGVPVGDFDFRRAIHGHGCTSTVRGAHRKSFVPSQPCHPERSGAEEPALSEAEGTLRSSPPATPLKAAKDERGSSAAQRCHRVSTSTRETLIKSRFPPCTPVYPVVYAFCRH